MRINQNVVKLSVLVMSVVGLHGFSDHRSNNRKIDGISINFLGDNNLYTTEASVNKLLIQNYGPVKNRTREKLVLNTIEKIIQSDDMVKEAQVYFTVDGKLISKIVQRKPIGRIEGMSRFYLDDEGKRMPLSKHHSARVPIITDKITNKSLGDAHMILNYINGDDFLKKNVIGIQVKEEGQYRLRFRMEDFVVNLGGVDNLDGKFKNFMAFYAKAAKDNSIEQYAKVSLEFNNQVVCTKI